jgi:hypothetical protein
MLSFRHHEQKVWALVVRRGNELKRTPFTWYRNDYAVPAFDELVKVAREHGWTIVAYIGVKRKDLEHTRTPSGFPVPKREHGLVDIV